MSGVTILGIYIYQNHLAAGILPLTPLGVYLPLLNHCTLHP